MKLKKLIDSIDVRNAKAEYGFTNDSCERTNDNNISNNFSSFMKFDQHTAKVNYPHN